MKRVHFGSLGQAPVRWIVLLLFLMACGFPAINTAPASSVAEQRCVQTHSALFASLPLQRTQCDKLALGLSKTIRCSNFINLRLMSSNCAFKCHLSLLTSKDMAVLFNLV
jgi:hypothetical protein